MKPKNADAILTAEDFAMPFGKYKGRLLRDLPESYLKWAAENINNDRIATLCDKALQARQI